MWGAMQLASAHNPRSLADDAAVASSGPWARFASFWDLRFCAGAGARDAFLDLMLWAMTFLAVAAMLQMYLTPGRVFGIIPVADSVVGTLYYKN